MQANKNIPTCFFIFKCVNPGNIYERNIHMEER